MAAQLQVLKPVLQLLLLKLVSLLHFKITFAPLAARYWSGPPGGRVRTTPKISESRYLNFVFGSVYLDGKPVMSQYCFWCAGCRLGALSMFVYVTAGPNPKDAPFAALCMFFSSTSVDRLCAACVMFTGLELAPPCIGVMAPSEVVPVAGKGVEAPELFCVASTEASRLFVSPMICFVFLFLRPDGFQLGLRNGFAV